MLRFLTVVASALALACIVPATASASMDLDLAFIAFGNQPVSNGPDSRTLRITNSGGAPQTVNAITFSGTYAARWGASGCIGSAIAAGDFCDTTITFNPTTIGYQATTITVDTTDNDPSINSDGTGLGGTLNAGPGPLDFGSQPVSSGATGSQSVSVLNSGNTGITIQASLSGTDGSEFSLSGSSCPVGTTGLLPGGASCDVVVSFDPSTAGMKAASVVITGTGEIVGQTSDSFNLTGLATDPEIIVTPTTLAFGTQDINAGATATQAVTVSNVGNGPLLFGYNSGFDARYVVPNTGCFSFGGVLPAGASCVISIAFDPSSAGNADTTFAIGSNDANEPSTNVTISGAGGDPELGLSAASLAFGVRDVADGPTAIQNLVITNSGSSPLTTLISSTNASEFPLTATGCSLPSPTVGPGGTCTIRAAFDPSSDGGRTSWITIASNDADESSVLVQLTGIGVSRQLDASAASVAFGSQPIAAGAAGPTILTFTSSSSGPVTVSSVALAGANPGQFILGIENCTAGPIASGNSCTVSLGFNPDVVGAATASLVLTHNAGSGTTTIPLTGTGTDPEVVATNTTLAFGTQAITDGATPAQTVTLQNTGTATLTFALPAAPASYAFAGTGCATLGGVLSAGASCQLAVTFDPSATGAANASFTITTNDADEGTIPVTLPGAGGDREIDLVGGPLAFGSRDVNDGASTLQTIAVTNSGTAPLTYTITSSNPTEFPLTLVGCSAVASSTLAGGATCTIRAAFDPASIGARASVVTITSNDANEGTLTVNLSGTGVARDVTTAPTAIAFGSQAIDGGATAARTVTVTNTGDGPLAVNGVSIVGADASHFQLTGQTCTAAPVAAAGSCTATVTFDPAIMANLAAQLQVGHDAGGGISIVTLTGTGTAPSSGSGGGAASRLAQVQPTAQTFGARSVAAGPTDAQTVTLINAGTTRLTVGIVAVTGPGAREFVVGAPSCASGTALEPSASCTVQVRFDPTEPILAEATLQWAHDGPGLASSVALSGLGCSITHRSGCPGNDRFAGTPLPDIVFGGLGVDILSGAAGNDQLTGGFGNDVLDGGAGRDELFGGENDDRITGGPGADTLRGGEGNDTILARDRTIDIIDCGRGARDVATVDRIDRVVGCERVLRA
jgi:hypothetical protein